MGDLDGHRAVQLVVPGQIHQAEPALAQHAFDPVAADAFRELRRGHKGGAVLAEPRPGDPPEPRHDRIDQAVEPRGPLLAFGADVEVLGHSPQLGDGELAQHELGELVEAGTVGSAHRCLPVPAVLCFGPARTQANAGSAGTCLLAEKRHITILELDFHTRPRLARTATLARGGQGSVRAGIGTRLARGWPSRNVSKPAARRYSPRRGTLNPVESTSLSLLRRALAREPDAWKRLVGLYTPLVHHWCRQAGIAQHDVADVTQEVFAAVASSLGQFHPDQPGTTFRGWMRGITRHKLLHHRHDRGEPAIGGSDAQREFQQVAAPTVELDLSESQDEVTGLYERALHLVQHQVEDRTWTAFWKATVESRHDRGSRR